MSRYIEMAHQVRKSSETFPGVLHHPARHSQGAPMGRTKQPIPRDPRSSRLINLQGNVARHEANLAEARTSPSQGSQSAGLLLQLTRRLHQARQEIIAFNGGSLAAT